MKCLVWECPRCNKHFVHPPGKHDCYTVIKKRGRMIRWAFRRGWAPPKSVILINPDVTSN